MPFDKAISLLRRTLGRPGSGAATDEGPGAAPSRPMVLRPCTEAWGGMRVLEGPLAADGHDEVLFLPFAHTSYFSSDPTWGVYSRSGELIEAAALRIREGRDLVGQSQATDFPYEAAEPAPAGDYVYGGPYVLHYGHFLCTTLARLWYVAEGRLENAKLVFHSHQAAAHMMGVAYVRACFEALGLDERNIFVPERPTRFARLIVPEPSFEEQSFVHPAYRDTCRRIGRDHAGPSPEAPLRPVYLTKTGLTQGVGRITNEMVIEEHLRSRGVEIVHPERLSWTEQVRLFSQPRVIAGTVGSAFHTSIFAQPRARLVGLSAGCAVNSNLLLADAVSGVRVRYVYPQSGINSERNHEDSFITQVGLAEPYQTARDLGDLIEQENAALGGPAPDSWPRPPPGEPVVDKLSFATRNLMRDEILRFGWSIGAHTYGHPEVMEAEHGSLTIGRFCSISSKAVIVLGRHRSDTVSSYPFATLAGLWPGAQGAGPDHVGLGGVEIGHDVWIGFGAMILPGARIGNGCFIQSGAVVDGPMPDYAIVAGNPGRVVGMRFDRATVRRLQELAWWDWDEATLERFMPLLASGDIRRFLQAVEDAEPV